MALPAEMPLEIAGDAPGVDTGRQLTYTIRVCNDGPNDVPDAEVLGTISTELSDRTLDCEPLGGATAGEGSAGPCCASAMN